MAELVGASVSAAPRALKKLEESGVLERRREFRHVYYRFAETPLADLLKARLQ